MDESYYSTVMPKGEEEGLKKVLAAIFPPEWRRTLYEVDYSRACKAQVYKAKGFPAHPIAPSRSFGVLGPKDKRPNMCQKIILTLSNCIVTDS